MAAFEPLILPVLNHLIQAETWAGNRLRPFSGSQLLVVAGPVELSFCIDQHGLLTAGNTAQAPDVTLTLPADAATRFLLDRSALFSSVKLAGSADLAEALAFVFRNLRWDIEADMAHFIGDIAARRLTLAAAQLSAHVQDSALRTAQSFAEFATEDSGLLAAARDIQTFGAAVDCLRDATARLEKRIERL
ncbi:MAG: hypothetical protein CVU16_09990 [Betaproteobacteria bacterium HGW-Betaproteobacteria-10]|jgi:ubiquinone biosynthesis protein UbiJ|nr:MAG: hypothetical protein CVU16_09990 [Betaproteobacteria bacterium HGW-Betaproteobacteria-10]